MTLRRKKNPTAQEAADHLLEQLQAIATRAASAREQADKNGATIVTIADHAAGIGVTRDMMKWSIRTQVTDADQKTEAAWGALCHAEHDLAALRVKVGPTPLLRWQDQLIAAAEEVATQAKAYLQATQRELGVWMYLIGR